MTTALTETEGSGESISPFWGWRGNRRPDPKFGQVFAGLGGFSVGWGVVIFAGDRYGNDQRLLGAFMCLAAVVAAIAAAKFIGDPFRAACAGLIIPTIYGFWGMLIFGEKGSDVDDMKLLFLLASLSYVGVYLAKPLRGRGVFLVLALIGIWMLGVIQVGDSAFSNLSSRSTVSEQTTASRKVAPAGQAVRIGGLVGGATAGTDYCNDPDYADLFPEECDPNYSGDDYTYDYSDDTGSSDDFSDVTSSNPFSAIGSAGSRFGNDVSWLTLIVGLGYLAIGFGLDRKRRTGFATPFIGTALFLVPLGAVLTSYDFTSLEDTSTARIGAQMLIAGAVLCAVGAMSVVTRRATTWLGAALAFSGASTWIIDAIRPESANEGGGTALLLGAIMIAVGFIGALLMKEGAEQPTNDGPDLQPAMVAASVSTTEILVTEVSATEQASDDSAATEPDAPSGDETN